MFKRIIFTVIVLMMMIPSVSARVVEDVEMPETLTVEDKTVALNGAGLRKVMFMKPYVAGLYLRAPETDASKIMMADELQVLRLELLSGQSRMMFLRAFRNGMRAGGNSVGLSWDALEPQYEKFTELLSDDFNGGDVFEFTYIPGEGVRIIKNDELRGTLEGIDFKRAFFGIWLNEESPADDDLKAAMIAGDMEVSMAEIKQEEMALAEADTKAEEAARKAEAEAEEAARKAAEEKAAAEAEAKKLAEKKAAEEKAKAEAEARKAAEEKAKAEAEAQKAAEMAAEETEEKAADTVSRGEFAGEPVYFGFDDSSLSAAAKTILDKKVEWLKANPDVSIALEASTDAQGPSAYNEWLAERRGTNVKNYLTEAGIDSARLEVDIIGEIAVGDSEKNRRVQFRVK